MYSRKDYNKLKKATDTICRYCNNKNQNCEECIVMKTLNRIYENSPLSKDSDNELKVYKLTVRFIDYMLIEEYDTDYYQAHDAEEAELLYEKDCERSCDICSYTAKELTQEEIDKFEKCLNLLILLAAELAS